MRKEKLIRIKNLIFAFFLEKIINLCRIFHSKINYNMPIGLGVKNESLECNHLLPPNLLKTPSI
tara:strand:- start:328 stop:519 length:192 start_codon:yes stop_codon:yes gene_type:complete